VNWELPARIKSVYRYSSGKVTPSLDRATRSAFLAEDKSAAASRRLAMQLYLPTLELKDTSNIRMVE